MAMASSGTKIAPEASDKLEGALNLSILTEDYEEGGGYGASRTGQPQSLCDLFSSTTTEPGKENGLHNIELNNGSSSSSTSSHKGKLPTVLEESESLSSHRDNSSTWDISSSSSLSSIASSSASTSSSMHAFLRKGANRAHRPSWKSNKPWKPHKKADHKKESLLSLLLWPLRKVRDAYMSCMMGLDGVGDLSGLAQGSTFATSSKYFADLPMSKRDSSNHG